MVESLSNSPQESTWKEWRRQRTVSRLAKQAVRAVERGESDIVVMGPFGLRRALYNEEVYNQLNRQLASRGLTTELHIEDHHTQVPLLLPGVSYLDRWTPHHHLAIAQASSQLELDI